MPPAPREFCKRLPCQECPLFSKRLSLPRFGIPAGPPPRIPPDVYWEWAMQNILRLHRDGQLERLRNRPNRRPVDARFDIL